MNIVDVLKDKDILLKKNSKLICNNCNEEYFSPFDRLYILTKGQCYLCSPDERLAENILNNIWD